jgi:LuxR family transcriptional regulator, activator of conjugal transfer of Ti plasmids
MYRVFPAFIDGLAESSNAESLRAVLAEPGAALDLNCFAYLSMPARRGDAPELISSYPVAWTDHYLGEHYERVDPVIVDALTGTEPFEWGRNTQRDVCRSRNARCSTEAAQFGIRCGFTVPIHDSRLFIGIDAYLDVCCEPAYRRASFRRRQRCLAVSARKRSTRPIRWRSSWRA